MKAWLSLLDVVVLGSANSSVHLVPLLLLLLPSQLRPPLLRISFTLLLLLLLLHYITPEFPLQGREKIFFS